MFEIAVGYFAAWLIRKAKLAAGRADTEIDQSLDTTVARLGELIRGKLSTDPALQRAEEEATPDAEEISARTLRRLTDSLDDAAEHDLGFATLLTELTEKLREQEAVTSARDIQATDDAQVVNGPLGITAQSGSAAALRMGDVTLGTPRDPQKPGPERG